MTFPEITLLFAGGVVAGVINVVAGGAGFMTFPLLVAAGMTEIEANASNFVAVLPANVVGSVVYRHEIKSVRKHLPLRLILAAAGGVLGSLLLVYSEQASFQKAIPWLLFFATISFTFGPWLKNKLERDFAFDGSRWIWLSFVLEFLVYVYGGYFGLGMGIVMFAIYSIFSRMTIHEANANRNVTISLMTIISIVIFARWRHPLDSFVDHDGGRDGRRLWRVALCQAHAGASGAWRDSRLGHLPHGAGVLEIFLSSHSRCAA